MEQRTRERRCSYVVAIEHSPSADELRELAGYLSSLNVAACEVIVLDASSHPKFEENARVLRWVGAHRSVEPAHRSRSGALDLVRAAASVATCEKVIVAAHDVRYTAAAIDEICAHLDLHEVVEPQDYLDPMPWWGGIEAGRILLHRGIEPQPDHGATLAVRRSVINSLRLLHVVEPGDDMARRLEHAGADVSAAASVFVRRDAGALREWLHRRARAAGDDLALPMKSFFFLSLIPLLLVLATLADLRLAATYAGIVSFASFALAVRGRIGATQFFPLHAALFAPLWVAERSVSVYWALIQRIRGSHQAEPGIALPEGRPGSRVASGE